jgi:hypothetical protein
MVHFYSKETDSKTVTVTAPVDSLEAFLILVVLQADLTTL